MALARTDRTWGNATSALSNYPTASFSVASGDLVIAVFQYSMLSADTTLATVGGGGTTITGITWTQIASQIWGSSNVEQITAWYGVCASNSTGVLTFVVPSGIGAAWSVFTYTGHDTAGPVSAGLTIAEGQPITGPIDVSALTGALTVWGAARNSSATEGAHSGATVIHNHSYISPTRNLITFEEAGENSPDVTWSTTFQAGMVAFKIREAAGVGITVAPASLSVAVTFGAPTLSLTIQLVESYARIYTHLGTPALSFMVVQNRGGEAPLQIVTDFGTPTLVSPVAGILTPASLSVAVAFGLPATDLPIPALVPASLEVAVTFGVALLFRLMTEDPESIVVAPGEGGVRLSGGDATVRLEGGAGTVVTRGRRRLAL